MLQAVKTIRDQLEGGEEARVEVNQRALIDKVLARYSGEFTCGFTLRSVVVHSFHFVSIPGTPPKR
jgi:hypothetical protein